MEPGDNVKHVFFGSGTYIGTRVYAYDGMKVHVVRFRNKYVRAFIQQSLDDGILVLQTEHFSLKAKESHAAYLAELEEELAKRNNDKLRR